MEHPHHEETGFKKFTPLIAIFTFIVAFTMGLQISNGWSWQNAMLDFMAAFFLIFGMFKVVRLRAFAEAYASYDLVAMRSRVYAYLYPFLEVALGLAYYVRFQLEVVNWIALVFMTVSSLGVLVALLRKRKIECACLGTVFKFPMTKVTLVEDLLMLAMAAWMLLAMPHTNSYELEFSMEYVEGTQVELTYKILDEFGSTVSDFEIVHEKPMHLIGVRRDLHEFVHVHPEMNWDGTWTQVVELPSEGPYQFYADFTPMDGEAQVLTFNIGVGEFVYEKWPTYESTQAIEGYQLSYHFPESLKSSEEVHYSLSIEKDGQAVLPEPYLGARGHSVVIQEDTLDYQHVHPSSESGAEFTVHFESAGRYAIFTQVQLEGQVLTVSYTVSVEEGEDHESMEH